MTLSATYRLGKAPALPDLLRSVEFHESCQPRRQWTKRRFVVADRRFLKRSKIVEVDLPAGLRSLDGVVALSVSDIPIVGGLLCF